MQKSGRIKVARLACANHLMQRQTVKCGALFFFTVATDSACCLTAPHCCVCVNTVLVFLLLFILYHIRCIVIPYGRSVWFRNFLLLFFDNLFFTAQSVSQSFTCARCCIACVTHNFLLMCEYWSKWWYLSINWRPIEDSYLSRGESLVRKGVPWTLSLNLLHWCLFPANLN